MKKIFVLTMLLLATVTAFGQTKSIPFETSGRTIKGIDAATAFNVVVVQGSESSAIAVVPQKYADKIVMTLESDGTLHIKHKGALKKKKGEELKAYVTCPTLNKLEASSAAKITIDTDFEAANLDVESSSASQIVSNQTINVKGSCSLDASSASKIQLQIVSNDQITIDASSASNIELSGTSKSLEVEASSASKVKVDIAAQTITVDASSACGIELSGKAESLNIDASSGSRVNSTKLVSKSTNVDSGSGASVKTTDNK